MMDTNHRFRAVFIRENEDGKIEHQMQCLNCKQFATRIPQSEWMNCPKQQRGPTVAIQARLQNKITAICYRCRNVLVLIKKRDALCKNLCPDCVLETEAELMMKEWEKRKITYNFWGDPVTDEQGNPTRWAK